MTIKTAIEKAIEGGWKEGKYVAPYASPAGIKFEYPKCGSCLCIIQKVHSHWSDFEIQDSALLDPKFWRCLGKSMNWSEEKGKINNVDILPSWLYHWHRFIDHLASGKDIDSFFEQL